MTREEAILWLRVLKHSKINWVGEKAEDEDIIARCEEAEQEAFDMAIEALSTDTVATIQTGQTYGKSAYIKELAEVVRCKDCIRNNDGNFCDIAFFINDDGDGFCNCGERREDANTD